MGIKCKLRCTCTDKRGMTMIRSREYLFLRICNCTTDWFGSVGSKGREVRQTYWTVSWSITKRVEFPLHSPFHLDALKLAPLMLSLNKYSWSKNPANYSTSIFDACKKARTTGLKLTCWPPLAAAPRRVSTACSLLLRSSRCASTFSFSLRTKSNSLFLSSSDDSSVFSCQ